MWNNYIADIEKSGKKVKDVIKDEKKTRKEYDNIAQRRVRLGLFFNKIAEDESITVSDDEVNKALFEQARNYPGQESEIIKLYQENPGAMMQIRSPLVEEKVVDHILTLVKIKEEQVDRAKLLGNEHEHDHEEQKTNPKTKKKVAKSTKRTADKKPSKSKTKK